MKKKNCKYTSIGAILSLIIMATIPFGGCYKENDMDFDDNATNIIANSPELEDYIIAYTEFQETFGVFNKELENIKFKDLLKKAQNAGGSIELDIPAFVSISNKLNALNDKKELLVSKYPQVISFSPEVRQSCIRQSIKISPALSKKMLELEVNQPRLKGGSVEFFPNGGYCDYLADYVQRPDYVEVIILVFADGTSMAYIDDNATSTSTSIELEEKRGRLYSSYYPSSPIETHIHTHIRSGAPSSVDRNNLTQAMSHAIYYNGILHYYW